MKNSPVNLPSRFFMNFTPNCHFGRLPFVRVASDQRIAPHARFNTALPYQHAATATGMGLWNDIS